MHSYKLPSFNFEYINLLPIPFGIFYLKDINKDRKEDIRQREMAGTCTIT